MFTVFSIASIFLMAAFLSRFLTEWLANRPDSSVVFAEEEVMEELECVFVPRDLLSFSVEMRSVPILLKRLTEAVGLGFTTQQAEALAYRVENQRLHEYYHAIYPIEVKGQASDLEFQWRREDAHTVRMAICAVEEVLSYTLESVGDLAIENRA